MTSNNLLFCLILAATYACHAKAQSIPVILIHSGASNYLQDSIWQAQQYNNPVILLTDTPPSDIQVECYNYSQYLEEANYFKSLYKHLSTNHYNYELFCFQRWFILKAFMTNYHIKKCFYCDSDVMLYSNVTTSNKPFEEANIALSISPKGIYSGGYSYWTQEALVDFCNYLINYYKNTQNINRWTAWFDKLIKNKKSGGVCDMTLLTEYAKELDTNNKIKIKNLREIFNDETFEHHIATDEDGAYEMTNINGLNIKNITWQNNKPHAFNKILQKNIRFKALHFQGNKKCLMNQFRRKKLDSHDL